MGVAEAVGVAEGVGVPLRVLDAVCVAVGAGEGVTVAETDAVGEGVMEGRAPSWGSAHTSSPPVTASSAWNSTTGGDSSLATDGVTSVKIE